MAVDITSERIRLADVPTRLEPPHSRFLDREDDLATIRSLLITEGVRLLTLTGPGGVGKTRLALEVGDVVRSHFAHGVVFVDLTSVRDPAGVLAAVADGLGFQDLDGSMLLARLESYLAERELLLILDNLEQVLSAAPALAELLAFAPGLTLLVTSREALHLRWEQIYSVSPLPLPDLEHSSPPEELASIPSVALFLQRARAINPGFALTAENARAVAELVVHLDGLPLAIELAAARTALLSPQMIVERLGQRLLILRWPAQDLPERQQTLRAAISWSYDLLSPEEQTFFRRLGVFAGSFSLRAADAIAEPLGIYALEALESLVDKSLVQVQGRDLNTVRYVLLESMREYARERLVEAGEQEEAGSIHARYYLALAEEADPHLRGRDQIAWYGRLEAEIDNLRLALRWLLDHDESEHALRLAAALGYFWWTFGYHGEGARWLEEALSKSSDADPSARARALARAGTLLMYRGDLDHAKVVLEEAAALARQHSLCSIIALPLSHLGFRAALAGDLTESLRLLQEALREAEQGHDESQIGFTLAALGYRALVKGDCREAADLYSASIKQFRALGNAASATLVQFSLAVAIQQAGRPAEAVKLLDNVLRAMLTFESRWHLSHGLETIMVLVGDRAPAEQRGRLLGALDMLTQTTGAKFDTLARLTGQDPATHGDQSERERLETARRAGRSLPFSEVVELALAVLNDFAETFDRPETAAAEPAGRGPLSPREYDVLRLVAEGQSNKQIARELIVAQSTVKAHMTSVFNKLGVDSRAHAVAVAAQRGIL